MLNLGTVPASSTIYIPFATYGGTNGESITCTGLAVTDIEIYKDGSTTQRASEAGYTHLDTDGIDFDSLTGIHGFSIDLSDNTDAGFFAVGSWYWVVVSAITVDAQTVNFIAAVFRIGPAESVAGYPKADVSHFAGTAITAAAGIPEVKINNIAANAITATSIAADAITEAKIADNAIAAEHLAAGAIDFATFAADCKTGTGLKANVESISANAITATAINADAITSAKIADDAISSEHINTGAFTADAFAADAIVAATLATGCLTADAFAADALVAATFATDCITADAIADNAIDAGAIAADAITAAKIADGAIDAATFAAGAITAAAIASNAIDADALAADAVDEIHDEVVEGTTTLRQAVRLILSVLTGKSSGGGTVTVVFRDIGDSKDRISATVDANGNRTAVGTRDGS